MNYLLNLIGKQPKKSVVNVTEVNGIPIEQSKSSEEVLTSAALDAPKEFSHESQPDELTPKEVAEFREAIEVLENNLDHRELVGNAITNILKKLPEKEQYREILLPEDCGTMVKALRESYGVAITIKSTKSKTKGKKQAEVDNIVKGLGDMEINI